MAHEAVAGVQTGTTRLYASFWRSPASKAGAILNSIRQLAATFDKGVSEAQAKGIAASLEEMTREEIVLAFSRAQDECRFFPVPAILREFSGRAVTGDPIANEAKEGLLTIINAMRGKHGPKLRDILGKLKYGTEEAPRNAEGGMVPYCDAPREPATPFVMPGRVENALVRLGWGSREAGIAIIADHPAVSRRDVDPDADDKYRQNQLRTGDEITNRFVAAYREVQG